MDFFSLSQKLFLIIILLPTSMASQDNLDHRPDFVPNRVVIKFKQPSSEGELAQFKDELKRNLGATVAKEISFVEAEVWDISDADVLGVVMEWKNDAHIEYIEPDYYLYHYHTGCYWGHCCHHSLLCSPEIQSI